MPPILALRDSISRRNQDSDAVSNKSTLPSSADVDKVQPPAPRWETQDETTSENLALIRVRHCGIPTLHQKNI